MLLLINVYWVAVWNSEIFSISNNWINNFTHTYTHYTHAYVKRVFEVPVN